MIIHPKILFWIYCSIWKTQVEGVTEETFLVSHAPPISMQKISDNGMTSPLEGDDKTHYFN